VVPGKPNPMAVLTETSDSVDQMTLPDGLDALSEDKVFEPARIPVPDCGRMTG